MQDENPKTATANPQRGRSSVAKLPAALRDAVDQAIADGATIDEITARIREAGENCSRSAVGRYAKDTRGLIRQRREADRIVKMWLETFGERPQGELALVLIETLRAMVHDTISHLGKGAEAVSAEDIARLSLALKRIEDADELRIKRERAVKKAKPATPTSPETAPWTRSTPPDPGQSRRGSGPGASHAEPATRRPSRRRNERLH